MIKVSLIVLCGLAIAAILRKQSAALRHLVLSAAIACAAVVPLVELLAPSWDFRRSSTAAPAVYESIAFDVAAGSASPAIAASHTGPRLAARDWLVGTWIAGAAANILILLAGLGRLRWLAARSIPIRSGRWLDALASVCREHGLRRTLTILQSDHPTLLVTWGVLRPKIVLPAGADWWTDDRIRIVLSHEVAHIARGDWVAQMLGSSIQPRKESSRHVEERRES
jgi:bla regulator protein BlaR1